MVDYLVDFEVDITEKNNLIISADEGAEQSQLEFEAEQEIRNIYDGVRNIDILRIEEIMIDGQ